MTLALWLSLALAVQPLTSVDADCSRALYLLSNRHLDPSWLDTAETLVAGTRHRAPDNPVALALQARLLLQRGDEAATRADRFVLYKAARAVADTLRRTHPNDPQGYLWWGTAQGKIGELQGIVQSLGMAGDIVRSFDRAIALDSGCALAWYARGRLYEALPAILGGSRRRAEQCFRRGTVVNPDYTIIRLDLARLLAREKRPEEACEQLALLLAVTNPTEPAEFALQDRPAAESLLARFGRN